MLFYNEDWIHFMWTRFCAGMEISEKTLEEYMYSLKDTQITDFILNVNGTVSSSPSKVLETFADKYLAEEENGVKADYKNTVAKAYYELEQKNIDMYQIWIDVLKKIGINPWISVRMNDCHGNMLKGDFRKSSYVEKNQDWHLAAHRERIGYFDKNFDFGNPDVRKMMLDYIDEQLSRYDVYGLELDWMRDFFLFKYGFEEKNMPLVKEFIEDVSRIIKKCEEKYNHEIKLALVLPPSPLTCIEKGFNILDFADKIDYINIIARWESTDTDMPVELWKQLLRGTDIKLGGGQQLLCSCFRSWVKPVMTTVKGAFGQAIANLDRGCDYIYLYNYMDMAAFEGELADWWFDDSIRNDKNRPFILANIGKKETLIKQDRSHVVTFNDFETFRNRVNPVFPMEFNEFSEYEPFKINVGEIPTGAEVRLILGIKGEINPEDITVYANCEKAEFEGKRQLDKHIYEEECYVFTIKENLFAKIVAEVKINKKCAIEYAEIEVLVNINQ